MLAVIVATLLAVPLLGLVTFVQLLYLESLRLRTRDLPSLRFFKATLEERVGLRTEQGAGAFSLIKHTLLVLLGVLYFAWFADGAPWHAAIFWQTALTVLAHHAGGFVCAAATAVPPDDGAVAAAAGAAAARDGMGDAPLRGGAEFLPIAGRPGRLGRTGRGAADVRREHRGADHGRHGRRTDRGERPEADSISGGIRRQSGSRSDDAAPQHRGHIGGRHPGTTAAARDSRAVLAHSGVTRGTSTRSSGFVHVRDMFEIDEDERQNRAGPRPGPPHPVRARDQAGERPDARRCSRKTPTW